MHLTLYEDSQRTIPLMQFVSDDDGSVRIFLREPMNLVTLLPGEVELVKTFLEIR